MSKPTEPLARQIPHRLRGYVRARAGEIAKVTTRATSEPLAEWAIRRIRLDGRPFSFAGHEFLRPIYDDTSPHIVLVKGAQVGGTTWAIYKNLHSCVMGLNCMYFFPTRTDVLDFSRSRVTPLLLQNPFLAKAMRDTDTVGLKKIGDSYLYLRGMQSEVGMKSVPADMLTFDELDEATPTARSMALERLAHSDYKRIIELSNPSLPDFGIDSSFQASDQRHWTVKCSACGRWVSLVKEFPRKLGEEVRIIREREDGTYYRACPRCDAELDIAVGEWIADLPGRPIRGYSISQLFSSKVDPGEILREYQTTRFPDRLFNLKVGIAWADRERRLDVASVLSLCGDGAMLDRSEDRCTMGIDTGNEFHVVILRPLDASRERHCVVHLAVCHDPAELDPLMKRFNVERCVIDALPHTHLARAFASRHSGRVFLSYFSEHQRGEAQWDGAKVTINRTDALDASRTAILERRVVLPRQQPIVVQFAEHLSADAKTLVEDPDTGAKRYKYIRTAADHFGLAFCYGWMAATIQFGGEGFLEYMRLRAETVLGKRPREVPDELTRAGWRFP